MAHMFWKWRVAYWAFDRVSIYATALREQVAS